jgi:predicted dehydrogenase
MTVRLGVLGTGLAAEIHSKTLRAIAPAVKRWYASRDRSRAAAFCARFGGAGQFESYQAAVESGDVDAVLIALPPALHREWAVRALNAGKHVIVEKPPVLTTNEFDEVMAAAAKADRQVMVAENYFYKPLTGFLKRAITGGDLGDVLLIQLNALKKQNTGNWRDDGVLAGGGALFEGGIHWVSLLANIGLTPVRVQAQFPATGGAGEKESKGPSGAGATRQVPHPERSAVVTIGYAEGAVATLFYSWDLPALINGLRISRVFGTRGTLRFETNGIGVVQAGVRRRLCLPGLMDLAGYRAMMTDFLAAIEQNRSPGYTVTRARRDLQLVEQAYACVSGSPHP